MSAEQASERLAAPVGTAAGPARGSAGPRGPARLDRGAGGALPPPLAPRAPGRLPGDRRLRPPPRTSPRSRSWPRSARSTASTAAGRSDRGCTGSPSTGRSTSPAPGRCGPRARCRRRGGRGAASRDAISDQLLAALASSGPSTGPWSCSATCSSTRPARSARSSGCPRGTVNSRLRRGLDRLRPALEEARPDERAPTASSARRAARRSGPRTRPRPRSAPGRSSAPRTRDRTPVRPPAARAGWALAIAGGVVGAGDRPQPRRGEGRRRRRRRTSGSASEDAKPALRSLPAAGELLVESAQGPWIVREDGSKRLLGDYDEAAWSPHGLYVVAADGRELAALEPDGDVRWTLHGAGRGARPALGRRRGRHPDRLPQRRRPAGDRRRRQRRQRPPDRPRRRAGRAGLAAARRTRSSRRDPAGPYVLSYVDAVGRPCTRSTPTPARSVPGDAARPAATPSTGDGDRGSAGPWRRSADGSRRSSASVPPSRARVIAPGAATGGRPCSPPAAGSPARPGRPTAAGCWSAGPPPTSGCSSTPTGRADVVAFDRISEQFDPGGDGGGRFPRVSGWILPAR